ncbi:MAG: alpha/beta hydrolase [Proteobacteria bacterium]|nr:alpha/beta hydrolase [Pseudomonadota bacterium]
MLSHPTRCGVFLLALLAAHLSCAETGSQPGGSTLRYGANPAAGHTFMHDGVQLYYETYGEGEPLLIVHGNGGSIADLAAQIAHFRAHYRVIAMDSRDQGRSGDSPDELTYDRMTDDLAALLDHLNAAPAHVLGWSDGGIQALLLAIRYPTKVNRIVAMAANLNPTEDAFQTQVLGFLKTYIEAIPATDEPAAQRERKVASIMLQQPDIDPQRLETITAPVLVLAGDRDLIRDEHTLEIYHRIPNSQLAIFPNATHALPFDDPISFNAVVERFLGTPLEPKDRLNDLIKSLEKMRESQQ